MSCDNRDTFAHGEFNSTGTPYYVVRVPGNPMNRRIDPGSDMDRPATALDIFILSVN